MSSGFKNSMRDLCALCVSAVNRSRVVQSPLRRRERRDHAEKNQLEVSYA
jgi:hypothetical protein